MTIIYFRSGALTSIWMWLGEKHFLMTFVQAGIEWPSEWSSRVLLWYASVRTLQRMCSKRGSWVSILTSIVWTPCKHASERSSQILILRSAIWITSEHLQPFKPLANMYCTELYINIELPFWTPNYPTIRTHTILLYF